jgi:dienelactone hydrolase
VGYSLGSSVALAAGSQDLSVDAIAEWYGSLPDEFFYQMNGMPPLLILHGERDSNIPITNAQQLVKLCEMKQLTCDHHFYSDQGHGFTGLGFGRCRSKDSLLFRAIHFKKREGLDRALRLLVQGAPSKRLGTNRPPRFRP